ncbi:putative ribosome quality control (RQC) complex YloA/Tae2 family protein [Mobilisporobacter senegalensis]|uniref:Rqc2 homolog RqcH n=1 Tax=Mobilisporobacter senegalensis TaxID=1329262 RepID=A0A3N1XVQ2_9FIRM|nr:NFACT RNA binding domain-containing protein [Mobilisporobacter senegalensis]ROR30705.1 putative ribosome quality control (RQC) complex YloA/Tae2 family protein [Mobilisporobacter senegalensis]
MALDGLVIANVVYELNEKLVNGRINKIAQPEDDELILTIKNNKEQYRLLLSAGASLPLIYLTEENKQSPLTAPNFCMLLRKHLNSAKILSITQPGLERIINIEIEHLNELGDVCMKHLMIELMGKHSNIIFCDENKVIVDSIKHISGLVSSVREVLPGRHYFIPQTQDKLNPFDLSYEQFKEVVISKPMPIGKAIYTSLTGISPLIGTEVCHRAAIDAESSCSALNDIEMLHLYKNLERLIEDIKGNKYKPNIVYDGNEPIEFSSTTLTCYGNLVAKPFDSISELLETYYSLKNVITRIRQKTSDYRRVVSNGLDRARKKYDLQLKQLKDTEKRDKYKVYGELINAYGYNLEESAKSLTALNYYTNEEITIPLDPTLSPGENAKKYFEKYNKLKRTYEALSQFIEETKEELSHLESISNSLDIALQEEDLIQLKEELMEYGYLKRKFVAGKGNKKQKVLSKPFHYISSDGYHMYVGKNNYQNEELTFKIATGNDWWFHAKGMAGSHVIVKTNGEELPDTTFEEAGKLAGFYSKARGTDKVEIDYTQKKNVKKPSGGKPGFVVYYTNYSLMITPDITGIVQVKD